MAIELNELIKDVRNMDITLLAGENGLDHLVSWVHMAETKEAASFLSGGEIVFLTGLGLSDNCSLFELILEINVKEPAAIVANIGPYIDSIPPEVIDFCNSADLPLFVVPWKIHLAKIMKTFCSSITRSEHKEQESSAAFKNAIHFPKEEELYVVPLSNRGFNENSPYAVTIIRYKDTTKVDYHLFVNKIQNFVRYNYDKVAVFEMDNEIVIIISTDTEDALRSFTDAIHKKTTEILGKTHFHIGVGRLTKSIRCLYKSYNQANAIVKLNQELSGKHNYFYSDMGMYRLLIGIEDQDIINDFLSKTLVPIEKYDKENESNLLETLECYLHHNGSVKETSEELFIHRNTTNYKINKVEEILGMDLSLLETRTQLILAFALKYMGHMS